MDIDEEIHNRIANALRGANFPINNNNELSKSFPKGKSGVCKSGAFEITVEEAVSLLVDEDFPFNNSEEVAHVIIKRLNREGLE
jgi:hypothetical protein